MRRGKHGWTMLFSINMKLNEPDQRNRVPTHPKVRKRGPEMNGKKRVWVIQVVTRWLAIHIFIHCQWRFGRDHLCQFPTPSSLPSSARQAAIKRFKPAWPREYSVGQPLWQWIGTQNSTFKLTSSELNEGAGDSALHSGLTTVGHSRVIVLLYLQYSRSDLCDMVPAERGRTVWKSALFPDYDRSIDNGSQV